MNWISYWQLPVISGCMWLATLLGLLLWWVVVTGEARLPSMSEPQDANQTIAYISDVGADKLKPLFVAGAIVTTLFLDATFAADRWLRHKRRLAPNVTRAEKVLNGLTLAAALLGTVGLTCLSGFDTLHYKPLHDAFLFCFIIGYVLSAIFICAEYQILGKKYRQHPWLAVSFWVKLAFVIVEVGLAIGFGVCNLKKDYDRAAILEWTIAFIFALYVFSFVIDLAPAVRTKNGPSYDLRPMNTLEVAEQGRGAVPAVTRPTEESDRTLTNGATNGHKTQQQRDF